MRLNLVGHDLNGSPAYSCFTNELWIQNSIDGLIIASGMPTHLVPVIQIGTASLELRGAKSEPSATAAGGDNRRPEGRMR